MSSHRLSGRSRPAVSVVSGIIEGRPWTARHISNNRLRQHCRLLARTFRNHHPLTDPLRDPCQRLLKALLNKSDLLTHTHPSEFPVIPVLTRLAAYSGQWIREPENWTASGACEPRELIRQLAEHLLARWPMPACFDSAWRVKGELEYLERDWYCHLANGGSLRKARGMPPSITARALHLALSAPADLSIRQALRWGQIKAVGGSDGLMAEVLSSHMVKDLSNDAIWSRLFKKLAAAHDFDPRHFEIIADTLSRLLSRGATSRVEALLKLTADDLARHSCRYWETLMAGMKRNDIHNANLRSELRNKTAMRWQPLGGSLPHRSIHRGNGTGRDWHIEELTNPYQLTVEGMTMGHCVRSYARKCREQQSAIFSLRTEHIVDTETTTKSHLTIEVAVNSRKILQMRGRWNQMCSPVYYPVIRKWAHELGLKM